MNRQRLWPWVLLALAAVGALAVLSLWSLGLEEGLLYQESEMGAASPAAPDQGAPFRPPPPRP
jgi:hypothetical protein